MKHPWAIWVAFVACVCAAASALAWLGATMLRLERAEFQMRQQSAVDERVQLALWRMESALAPLIAEEGARPFFTYSAFYPTERAYTRMFEAVHKGDVLVASPLLTLASDRVLLHFQFAPDGALTSPQVPGGNMRDLAESRYINSAQLETAVQRLDTLRTGISQPSMQMACSIDSEAQNAELMNRFEPQVAQSVRQSRGTIEYEKRAWNMQKVKTTAQEVGGEVAQDPLLAAWIGDFLILGRGVRVGNSRFLQGCWLNWPAIRAELQATVADLIPGASLEPVRDDADESTRRLAALPIKLVPGSPATLTEVPWSPLRVSLTIAWAGLLLSAGAIALVLASALALSERRAAFVSAVTHELRTPLTTFRLYTEMLRDQMVADPKTRSAYLETLHSESSRLGHLVENVLSFARLERGRSIVRRDLLTPRALLDRAWPALEATAQRGGMALVRDCAQAEVTLRTDASIVEQILSNLLDNATKYASTSGDRRIQVSCELSEKHVMIKVRDHGPGLSERALSRLFRPFSKSAHDAAASAPGVGLGLALSRRLARALGGDLRLIENSNAGACFGLQLEIERRVT